MIKEFQKLREYIKRLLFHAKINNPKDITEPIVKAIRDKETPVGDPKDVVDPIVEAQKETTEAVRDIDIPETDTTPLKEKLEELRVALEKKDLTVNVGKTKIDVDTKSIVKAIQKLEKNLPKFEKQEQTDYTLMLDQLMKILETAPRYTTEILRINDVLNTIAEKQDFTLLAGWLKLIAEKEYPDFPDLKFEDGRLLVKVDRVGKGGGGGGLTAIETGYLETISTNSALLEDIKTAVENIDIDADTINLNTDGLEAKLDTLNAKDFATSAKQDTGNTSLASIKTNTDKIPASPATAGNQTSIITKIGDILGDYKISDIDADASPNYYGFLRKDGAWYIIEETVSAGADTYRYVAGSSGYDWSNRASESYATFNSAF